MKKNIKSRGRSRARPVLGSVGVAVLATLMAGGSHAAGTSTVSDVDGLTASVTGHATVGSPLDQSGDVGGTASGQNVKITVDGPQAGTSNVLTQNPINATAKGNSSNYAIDLSTTGSTPVDGAAILGLAGNSGQITSQANGNAVAVDLNGFTDGSVSNTQNTIGASTTLNQGTSSIAGAVPGSYTSTTPGQTTLSFGADGSVSAAATGSVVVTSQQQGTGAASSATTGGNLVGVNLGSDTDNTVASSPVLDNNTVSATLKGNSANSVANLQSGDAPAFAGSAVVSNLQANLGDGVTHSATSGGNSIIATVSGGDDAVNTLKGALSVQGNAITSAATGNEALGATTGVAGNRILLGDGLSFAGAGSEQSNTSTYDHGALSSTVGADLAIFNSQGNVGVSLSSSNGGGQVGAQVQSLDGGAIELSGNSVTSAATGNAGSSALASGADAASFAGTAAIANQQINYNGGVSASTAGAMVGAFVAPDSGTTHDSTVSVSGNNTAATAYGNSGSQSLALGATTLGLGGSTLLQGGGTPDGNVSATGAATLTNLQGNYSAAVSASNTGSTVGLSADSGGASPNVMVGNTLTVDSNTQEAVALGNSAGNKLALSGGSVGSGAGISNAQIVDNKSAATAELADSTASLYAGTHVQDSSLALTNNLQRAIGYGNSASNALGVTANGITAAPTAGPASTVVPGSTNLNTVQADYGVLNTQSVQSNVGATASGPTGDPDVTAINTLIEGSVSGSSVATEKNAFVAAAYGNDASSAATLALGTGVTALGGASIANVTNVQDVAGADTAITATANGGNVVRTSIEDDVTGSTVSTSGNQVQALAYGSRASNALSATGNSLSTAAPILPSGGASIGAAGATTTAAFSVQNVQSGAGTVTATQLADTTSAAQIRSQIGGDVATSTVTADDNSASASATSNSAANTLGLTGNSLATTSALQNIQSTSAGVNALVGLAGSPGSPGTPPAPFVFNIQALAGSGFGGVASDGTVDITNGSVYVNASDLNSSQIAVLTGDGWTAGTGVNAGKLIHSADILGTVDSSVYTALNDGLQTPLSGVVPGAGATPTVASQGGVTLAIAGSTTGSRLSVSGNSNTAAATGNNAANTSTIAGNGVAAGTTLPLFAQAGDLALGLSTGAQADHVLTNDQAVTDAPALTTSVYGSFAIDAAAPATSITGSTLAVSDNTQAGTAVANTAVNKLAVTGTNLATTTALASQQGGDAAVSAMSSMGVSAPGAVSNSSIDMSGNSNTALGVINDVANTLTVSATNVTPVGVALNASATPGNVMGDHVLSNRQLATTSVNSTATTQLYNEDQAAVATSGLANSAVAITGNSTTAEASANRADNAVALNGASLQNANAGLSNGQTSSAAVTASATTTTNFALNADSPTPALNQSGVTVDGNSTTALARGNAATNTLDVAAGSSYGVSAAPTAGSTLGVGGLTQATAALMNVQENEGAVSATSTAANYQVALNATGGLTAGVSNGTVGVTANQVVAQAFGNSATNAVTVAALNTGTPTAAIGNYQVNRGNVIATASSVNYGVGITGGANASTLRVAGNAVNATAIGNSAVSSIAAR